MYDQTEAQCEQAGTAMASMKIGSALQANRPTKRQELEQAREQLLAHVERITQAIAALDRNPGAEEVMNAIDRCRY